MTKLRIKWNSDKILSLSAMSISFITLIIFIYQTNLMSRQNALSILPYLQVSTSNNAEGNSYILSVQNYGVGPAIIESVRLEYKGKGYDLEDYDDYLFDFLVSQASELDSITNVDTSTLNSGMAIPANTNYNIFRVTTLKDYQLFLKVFNRLLANGLRYEIRYKSIQDEHWLIHIDSEGPEKID
jgi:hypothetical protein